MTLQVLVATMNQKDHSLLEKMNIQSDAIIGNQCNRNEIEKFEYNGHFITYLDFNEKGVGLNRNNALMRAEAEYCMFADDDMILDDGYVKTVTSAFKRLPQADVLIFNLIGRDEGRDKTIKDKKINYLNYLKYGTARIAIKLNSVKKCGIYFNQCFGGGTEHSHGEDNLFLTACLNNGLVIYAVPEFIGKLDVSRESTWNTGYSEKYIQDQGALYKAISRRWWKLLCLQDAVRHQRVYSDKWLNVYKKMIQGRE